MKNEYQLSLVDPEGSNPATPPHTNIGNDALIPKWVTSFGII